jgi:hypothetical protein
LALLTTVGQEPLTALRTDEVEPDKRLFPVYS